MGPKLSVFFNGKYRLMFDFTRTLITDYPDLELDNDIDGFQFTLALALIRKIILCQVDGGQ